MRRVTVPVLEVVAVLTVALLLVRATGWAHAEVEGLSVTPASATNTVGTPHTVTVAYVSGGVLLDGVTVSITVTGANLTSGSCTTGATSQGRCEFTYTGTNAGSDTITAFADIEGPTTTTATKEWTPKLTATVATTSAPTGAGVAAGSSVTDTATVSGAGPAPGGTVAFFLCDPATVTTNGGDCASGGAAVGGAVALASGSATSAAVAPTAAGTYCWRAEYSGDAAYNPRSHTNNASECFTVVPRALLPATIATTSSPTGGGVAPGTSASDTATVSGTAGTPTGSVAFFLCAPAQVTANGGTCSAGGTQVGAAVALAGGAATSAATTATSTAGTYCWRAEYSGDATYAAASHTNNTSECFTVVAAAPDDKPPVCVLKTIVGGRKWTITAQDTGSGLASIVATTNVNSNTVIPAFTPGTTAPVVVTMTRIKLAAPIHVVLVATDMQGNQAICDPAGALLVRTPGERPRVVFRDIPQVEGKLTICNGDPGMKKVHVKVNHRGEFEVTVRPNENKTIDISSAMEPGSDNVIVVRGEGKRGADAEVWVWDGQGDLPCE